MPSLPSASTSLSVQAGTAPVSADLIAVIAPVKTLADGTPRLYSNLAALLSAHGYAEAAEYTAIHMDETDKPVLLVPIPIAVNGAILRSESVHTGTSQVTVAAASGGTLGEVDAILQVTNGGTVGTDQILLSMSLDGGTSFQPLRLGTASSYTHPQLAFVVTFGAGTLVAGDTILKTKATGPQFDSTGVTLAKNGLLAQQLVVRSWLFIGDVLTRALGQAIEIAVNAYETAVGRYVYTKFQARDWKRIFASKNRCAMVGGPAVTFAASGHTATRGTGSFIDDGFQVNDYVRITGTASNNFSAKVTGVTATVLTFASGCVDESAAAGVAKITAEPSYVFDSGGKTITRNRGSFVDEGFAVGDVIAVAGSASNDAHSPMTLTTVTATVLTASAATITDETAGSCTTTISVTETETAWMAAIDTMFAPITSSERVDIGGGRLTRLSPILGSTPRRPFQWADSSRSFQHDVKTTTWWKELGALQGWGIDGEHDERVNQGLLGARFSCARTWANGPTGAFVAMSVTRATDGSILGMTHNVAVANVAQTVVQRVTEGWAGRTLVLNRPDNLNKRTATPSSLATLAAQVNEDLRRNLLENVGGEGQRASFAAWTPATDDDLGIANATLHGTLDLELNGTLVHIATSVEVR